MACTSSCRTKDHGSYGECLRSKSLHVAYEGQTLTGIGSQEQRAADKNLEKYAKARSYGIQPKSTRPKDVNNAIRISEQTGTAFQA